jgi:hypothetical protein
MSIWNKILLVLIFLASLVFFHAAARTVKTYKYWANLADQFEKKLQERRAEIVRLQTADHEHPLDDKTVGVQQLHIDLGRVLASRGRIWTKCEKKRAAPDTKSGFMEVAISTDDSNAFAKNMLLYAFEEGDDQSPGKYLGEFRVDAVSQQQVVLASTTQLVGSLTKNVTESKAPWVLYEMMPTDEHEAFTNMPEDQRKWTSEEFVKDGQDYEGLKQDQRELVRQGKLEVDGKKLRPLRDYLAIFRACEMHRTLFVDRLESARRDTGYLEAAKLESVQQEAAVEKEKTQVDKELARAQTELKAVASLQATRQNMLNTFQRLVQQAIATNLKYAQEFARLQKEAADRVDRRARAMAQFGPGAH